MKAYKIYVYWIKELTFFCIWVEAGFLQKFHYCLEVFLVLSQGVEVDENIVEKAQLKKSKNGHIASCMNSLHNAGVWVSLKGIIRDLEYS